MDAEVFSRSPGGRFCVYTRPWEAKMSHWVSPPIVRDDEVAQTLFAPVDSRWSAASAQWLGDDVLRLELCRYPGNHQPPTLTVDIDCRARCAWLAGKQVSLEELERALDDLLGEVC